MYCLLAFLALAARAQVIEPPELPPEGAPPLETAARAPDISVEPGAAGVPTEPEPLAAREGLPKPTLRFPSKIRPLVSAELKAKVLEAVVQGRPGEAIFDQAALPHAARLLFEEGAITETQASTLLLRASADEELRPRLGAPKWVSVLAEDGSLSSEFRLGSFSPAQRAALADKVRALPSSERRLGVFEGPRSALGPYRKVYDALERVLFAELFPGTARGSARVVMPSVGLMQALLDARFGADAVRLRPDTLPATRPELLRGIGEGGRALALSYPGSEQLTDADGYEAGHFFYALHDFYHAYEGSRQPAQLRRLLPALHDALSDHVESVVEAFGPKRARGLNRAWRKEAGRLSDLAVDPDGPAEPGLRGRLLAELESFGRLIARESTRPIPVKVLAAAAAQHPALAPILGRVPAPAPRDPGFPAEYAGLAVSLLGAIVVIAGAFSSHALAALALGAAIALLGLASAAYELRDDG